MIAKKNCCTHLINFLIGRHRSTSWGKWPNWLGQMTQIKVFLFSSKGAGNHTNTQNWGNDRRFQNATIPNPLIRDIQRPPPALSLPCSFNTNILIMLFGDFKPWSRHIICFRASISRQKNLNSAFGCSGQILSKIVTFFGRKQLFSLSEIRVII